MEKSKCKGIVYRASVSSYQSNYGSVEVRKSLRILKRKSCPGCEQCGWQQEFIHEDIWGGDFAQEDYLGEIKHGKLYRFEIHTSYDYGSGYHEVDGTEFIEVQE